MANLTALYYNVENYLKRGKGMEVAEIRQKIVENQEKLTSFRRSL